MRRSNYSTTRQVRLAPIDSHDGMNRAWRSPQSIVNPNPWVCLSASVGFTGLALLVLMLPKFLAYRGLLQLSSLMIALMSVGLNSYLQATAFDEPDSDHEDGSHSTVIDINRLNRLN